MTAGVILSGGASTRFGGRPKALLRTGGETFLDHIVATLNSAGISPIVVVVGPHGKEIRFGVRSETRESVQWRSNVDWQLGRTGSIQTGLQAVRREDDALLWPVDSPFATPATVRRLLDAARTDALGAWFIPTSTGRGGHPILVKPPAVSQILQLRADAPLRTLIPALGPAVVRCPVDDPGVTRNVNTPEEFASSVLTRTDE